MSTDQSNLEAFKRITESQPVLTDIKYAHEVFPSLGTRHLLHAGPPLKWEEMCGPLQSAIVGAILFEEKASSEEEAWAMASDGRVTFAPCHSMGAVGPMTGIISRSMPLFEVVCRSSGRRAYSTINEGLGKVMRFGANDHEVIALQKWMAGVLAPAIKQALHRRPIDLKQIMAQALCMGDEMHQRNVAASSLFLRSISPGLVGASIEKKTLVEVVEFISGNEQFFLNLAMAACKVMADAAANIPGSTVVTAMSRNGTDFGIRVSCLGDQWFTAPVETPQGLFFPGYSQEDANPDMGDSSIVETVGLGGLAMAASPAVVAFVGTGKAKDAEAITYEMMEIAVGQSPYFRIPELDFAGVPTGIDVRRVVETGILPIINTGIAHNKPGVGQVGAGVVRPPMQCFVAALEALVEKGTSKY
jgi:hypothetical protein